MSKKVIGVVLATAAAALLAVTPVSMANGAKANIVKCYGVNACKSHGSCKSSANKCKSNACKGQGFVKMTKKQCEQVGGSTEAPATAQ